MSEADDWKAILEAERRRQHALVAVDLAELDRLFAEDLIHVHSTGLVHNKSQLLEHIERKRGFISIQRGPLDVRIENNIGIVTGPITNRMRGKNGDGEIVLEGFVTQVLRRTGDGWKFINFQLTPQREP
jgi:ketosteroid isomerase-like protein